MSRDPPQSRDADAPPRRKATLFCPSCDHESPLTGDWRRRDRGDRTAYVCPTCGTAVTERPAGGDASVAGETPIARAARAWGRLVTTPFRVLRVTAEAGTAGLSGSNDGCA
jgi:hypothetical protein